MKTAIQAAAVLLIGAVVVYAAVGPGVGVLYGNPLATIGTGLIGLGLTHGLIRRSQPMDA